MTILISAAIIVLAAFVVRRLLGITSGRWAATGVAVLVGELGTIAVLQAATGRAIDLRGTWIPIGVVLVCVISMLALALIDLLTGSRRAAKPLRVPRPLRALRRRAARSARSVEVTLIAVRQGLLGSIAAGDDVDAAALGRALAATFDAAGGLFVKLGQAMASQPQLVSPGVAAELARLQDSAAPSDPEAAIAVLEDELGPVDRVFADFTPTPAGTASIGQTYFARLLDGRDVVVKVQRPRVRESMERDLDILERLARRLEHRADWARALGIAELAAGFAETTREELDYRIEAEYGRDARSALRPDERISVPGVIHELTTARVLVQQRVDGRSVSAPGALDGLDGAQRHELADALLGHVVRRMLEGGRFHADPHPGNVFVERGGGLALIDWGATARLNRFERDGLIELFRGLQAEDPTLLRQAALRLGAPRSRIDTEALDRELARLLARAVLPGDRLDPAVLGEILVVFRDFGIRPPRSIPALFRTLMTLIGTLEVIAPGYDLIGAIRRQGGSFADPLRHGRSVRETVQQEVLGLVPVLKRLPGDIDELTRAILRGEVRARVSLLSEPEDVRVVWSIVNRAMLGLVSSAVALASALLLTVPGTSETGQVIHVAGGIGLSLSALLLLRVIAQILGDRD